MIFGTDRGDLRRRYAAAWQKHCDGAALSPLEAQIVRVVDEHPEYRDAVLGDLERDYTAAAGATNPFLHMALHLGIRDQVAIDRPPGISSIFKALSLRLGDPHAAEHRLIECLAETLWEARDRDGPPDEHAYVERLRVL